MTRMKNTPDYEQYGAAIWKARRRRKWKQADVAAMVGVSKSYISNIEHGTANPSYALVIRLCELLDIAEPETLTTESGEI